MGVPSEMRVSLKLARELNGLKQSEAAQKIGVSTDTLGNYERGKSYPDIPILRKIESVYGVPYDRLIFLPLDFGLTEKNRRTRTQEQLSVKIKTTKLTKKTASKKAFKGVNKKMVN
ncbi:helix-turn-helix transcriptional regulator [Anaerobutyricum hallii]|uniref:helix-turn-helix transcriptional regulator n=1 Tax=Anaerobutyricum hallii TaxID=39488 RepID=UPI002672E3DF|nr:helix-turn-helix transcriptional regulator [Anaerobutyricum hallii]